MSEERNLPSQTSLQGPQPSERVGASTTDVRHETKRTPTRPHTTPQPDDRESEEPLKAHNLWRRRLLLLAAVVAVLAIGLVYGLPYYRYAITHEWTDNAFIDGHIVQVSPQVAGHVLEVHVADNQSVKAGEVLVDIDPRDYAARLAEARALLQAAILIR